MVARKKSPAPVTSQNTRKILLGTFLGVSLLFTAGNIREALELQENQQLISVATEQFASHKYGELKIGDISRLASNDFAEIDAIALELNYRGSSVAELAKLLNQHASTEAAQARIIFAWIAQHITYDMEAFDNAINNDVFPKADPETVLRDRTTICSGYSNLYHALAQEMGLESAIVVGYGRGAAPDDDPRFQNVNHAWNSVRIDNAWYLLDATWGAGTIREGKFVAEYQPYYFATAPAQLIQNHYPEDNGWQLLTQAYSRAKFDNLPQTVARFYGLGLQLASHQNYQIPATERIDIKINAPDEIIALAELEFQGKKLKENAVLVNRQAEQIVVSVAPPEPGTYELTIFAKPQNETQFYGEVVKYQIEAQQGVAQLPKTYAQFHQHQASLLEPLAAQLKPNWSTYFNLVVPEATEVQVVNTSTHNWTPLDGYGSYFAGQVDIQAGNIAVVAKFPGEADYWQLVEYQAN